jgi:glyoxylase-like metal-dependent hydrolase (beta-lactamase superfamily II)
MSVSTSGRGAWAEPAVDLVAPGVYRVPLPLPNDGLTAVNVYVLTGADAVVLIDSGWSIPEARELLAKSLSELGLALGDIRRFLVTHVHRDHYTQAVAVRRDFGTTVALGAGERPALEAILDPAVPPLGAQLRALRLMGGGRLAEELTRELDTEGRHRDPDWGLPDEWLAPGKLVTEVGRVLEVIETPGHTQGHVVFHDTEHALLFAGDHVLPQITPSIGMEPVHSENPLGQFLDSLAVVRSRPDAMLLPAHGPVTDSVHARVDELIDHHGRRLEATEKVCVTGASTGYEVAGQLTWTRREQALSDLDPFNQLLAINETGAHLQLLLAQGRLRAQDVDGVRHYTGA